MNDRLLLDNIERLLRAKKVSADAISKKANRPDAIRNLRRRVAGEKQGSWTIETLEDIARAMDTASWELLRPHGALSLDPQSQEMVRMLIREELAGPAPRKASR